MSVQEHNLVKPCEVCGFELFNPIFEFGYSNLVFYNDARFRGRCILSLKKHFETWEEIDETNLLNFMKESQQAVAAIKSATGCARVNIAALSNKVAHVHLHLIPRFPDEEEYPDMAPWRDKREQTELPAATKNSLIAAIQHCL